MCKGANRDRQSDRQSATVMMMRYRCRPKRSGEAPGSPPAGRAVKISCWARIPTIIKSKSEGGLNLTKNIVKQAERELLVPAPITSQKQCVDAKC